MYKLEELKKKYLEYLFEGEKYNNLVDWACEILSNNKEEDDLEISLLASSNEEKEASELTKVILSRYLGFNSNKIETFIGKYIVYLYQRYKNRELERSEIEPILWRLFYDHNMPDWLVMLSRNCECSTDIDNYIEPFEQEFEYISNLWRKSTSYEEFLSKYDRKISNLHDV